MLTRSEAVDLVVIDSVAALTPKAEIERRHGRFAHGPSGAAHEPGAAKAHGDSSQDGTRRSIFINQLRQKIGVVFGKPETTTGGNALKFYASVRLDVRRIGQVKVGEDAIGNRTRVKVVKNKCAPLPGRPSFEIRWGTGKSIMRPICSISPSCARGRQERRTPNVRRRATSATAARRRAEALLVKHRDDDGAPQRGDRRRDEWQRPRRCRRIRR